LSSYSWTGNNPIKNIDPTGMDWYRNQKSGDLKWIDVTPNEDATDDSYKQQKGYDYVAGANATVGDIRDSYNFMQGDGAFGFSQFAQVASNKTGQTVEAIGKAFGKVPEKMQQADLALTNFGSSIKSMELGGKASFGIKSAHITLKAGMYSTNENTGGLFLNISGNYDINNFSIQEFASFDSQLVGYLSLKTNGIGGKLKVGANLGAVSFSALSNGTYTLGIGGNNPARIKVGFFDSKDIINVKTEEYQISN